MKLITKTTLYYLGIAIVVFSIGGVITYDLISKEIAKETDYYLSGSLPDVLKHLERAVKRGSDLKRFNNDQMQVVEMNGNDFSDKKFFSDTIAMHPHLNRLETMRKMEVIREIEDRHFKITMIDVFVEDSDIYKSVVKIITRLFALLALALIIGSIFIARQLLQPFNETLKKIESFKLQDAEKLNLPATGTTEFTTLNKFLNKMTDLAQSDYQALKKFSEDASHEIQTPLAIARGKLDLLADTGNVGPEEFRLIEGAQHALGRLSQVSKSLALLTKIENEEFNAKEDTDLTGMVNETVEHFKELFQMRDLKISQEIEDNVVIPLNKQLGSIMLNNLFHNAIKHNQTGGYVNIELSQKGLMIKNSGLPPHQPTETLFNRFEKDSENAESSGLGLAIVKEICDYHNLDIKYTFEEDHAIAITF